MKRPKLQLSKFSVIIIRSIYIVALISLLFTCFHDAIFTLNENQLLYFGAMIAQVTGDSTHKRKSFSRENEVRCIYLNAEIKCEKNWNVDDCRFGKTYRKGLYFTICS